MRSPDKRRADAISWGFQQPVQGEELPGQDSTWHVSFSDLTLLLLCFLLIGYWTQKKEGEKDANPVQEPAISTQVEPADEESDSWTTLGNEIEEYAKALGVGAEVAVASTRQDLVITFRDALLFDSGRADLREEVLPILQKVTAIAVSQANLSVEVLGHADNVPIARPEFPSNWELSTGRASRVARQLIESGIEPARLSVKGYGDSRPLAPNTSPENRRINRRVEIRLSRDVP
jgi:chemotaxis protein MotB